MPALESNQLPEILANWVMLELQRSDNLEPDFEQIKRSIQAVLAEPELSASEQTLIVEGAANYEDPLDLAVKLRVDRALRSGIESNGHQLGGDQGAGELLPTMLIMRDESGTNQEGFIGTMVATIQDTLSYGYENRPVLVLTEKQAYEDLHSQSETLLGATASVQFVDDANSMDLTLKSEVTVQVVEDLLQTVVGQAADLVVSKGLSVTPEDPMIGQIFANKYEIGKCVGRGGFGSVYLARDTLLDNHVAIKVLTPRTAITDAQKEAFKEQLNDFVEEARRLVRLEHENIVNWKVFDQTEDGTYFFVMELLQGEELDDLLKREGRLEPKRVASILLQVLEALNVAHNLSEHESILHLDLKPKNIFYLDKPNPEAPDRIKVIDFGIGQYIGANKKVGAKPANVGSQGEADSAHANDLATSEYDRNDGGTLKSIIHRSTACTPEYASPEQCTHMLPESQLEEMGTEFTGLDGRSDLYSLGVMGFQLLTGQLPFERPSQRKDFFRLHIAQPPRKTGKQGIKVPAKLAKFVDQCLVKDRDKRWKNTSDACHALRQIVNPPIWKPIALIGAPLLALVGFLAWQANSGTPNLFPTPRGPIYASAETPQTSIPLIGLPSSQIGLPTLIVSDPSDESSELPWTASWDNDRLLLEASANSPLESNAFLIVDPESSNPFTTQDSFTLVYLDDKALTLRDASVPELGTRAVDPEAQSMNIRIQGRASDIESVTVRSGTNGQAPATLVAGADQTAELAHFSVDLNSLQLAEGENSLEIIIVDNSGRSQSRTESLQVANGALSADQISLAGIPTYANRYRVIPSSKPRLRIELNRQADISWSLKLDSGGAPQPLGRTSKPTKSLDVDLDLTSDNAYQGSILVEISESAYVLHNSRSPNASSYQLNPLAFDYSDEAPDFLATYRNGNISTQTIALGEVSDPIFLNRNSATLEISLNQTSPVAFEIVRTGSDRIEFQQALTDKLQTSLKPTLDLGGPGIHDFEIRGFPCDTQTKDKLGEAVVLPVRFIVDDAAPQLQVAGPENVVLKDANWVIPSVSVSVNDSTVQEIPTPVSFNWEVRANGRRVDGAQWSSPVSLGSELAVEVALTDMARRSSSDGKYELRFAGTDWAGNIATPASYFFDVATTGPLLRLESPDEFTPWDIAAGHDSKRYEVRVRADDPNGVSGVHCILTDKTDGSRIEELALELQGTTEFGELWVGYFDLRSDWSKKDVELRFTGVDSQEVMGPMLTASREMALIEDFTPDFIDLVLNANPSAGLSPMCKVIGNRGADYTSRGRADSTENTLFKTAFSNLRYNNKRSSISWEINYAAGEIKDFYLDETEVSVGQFLKFVEAANGYEDSDNWQHGVRPDSDRHEQLAAQLRSQQAALPVTNITWDEASAYARWCGKRLPSLIEWEYAVRGGTEYRPFSAYRGEQRVTPNTSEFRYDTFGGEPWPVTQGKDQTPDTGIRNLCTNVSEWCWSPNLFDGVAGSQAKVHAQEHPEWVLDPSETPSSLLRAKRFWTVGGSFSSTRLDFSVVSPRDRNLMDSGVGFRCAVSAGDVLDAMESSTTSAWEVHERSK